MKKNHKIFLQSGLFLLCAAGIYLALRGREWDLLQAVNWQNILLCSVMIIAGCSCSGLQYFAVVRKMGCNLRKREIVLFPFMQSFWGLVIPFQGTSLFAVYYLKKNYSFQVRDSVTMILFLYLFNVLFGSLAGVAYSLFYQGGSGILFILSLAALGSPFYLLICGKLLKKHGRIPFLPEKINQMLVTFFSEINNLCADWKNVLLLVVLQLLRQLSCCVIFVVVAGAMGFRVPWLWGYFVAVSQELSIIIRFTPGNMGLAEMVSGFISNLTGVPVAVGVTVSLFNTLLQLVITLMIGGLGTLFAGGRDGFYTFVRKNREVSTETGDSAS